MEKTAIAKRKNRWSFPLRGDLKITISNVPEDLTKAEAQRLFWFFNSMVVGEEKPIPLATSGYLNADAKS